MYKRGIVLVIFAITLVIILNSGCISKTSTQPPCENCTLVKTTPLGIAADLHKKGFDAYINLDYAKALDYYNQSLAADPKYIHAWIDKGNVLVRMNRTEEAVAAYDTALALDNKTPEVWNSRGKAQMAAGNYIAARDSFDQAIQLAPEYAEAKENRNLTLTKIK
jgi:tetratricopeptide (TPR) repeat protein